MSKLTEMGITCDSHAWILAFLINHTQRVGINGEFFTVLVIRLWSTTRNRIGFTVVFVKHQRPTPACVKSQTRLFSDDCLLYCSIKSENHYTILQRDLSVYRGLKHGKCILIQRNVMSWVFIQQDHHSNLIIFCANILLWRIKPTHIWVLSSVKTQSGQLTLTLCVLKQIQH